MNIELSGVVMAGECDIQTDACQAPRGRPGPVLAVWQLPGRKQIDVCKACLEKKLADREWREAQKVRTTGVVRGGLCVVNAANCTARDAPGGITFVFAKNRNGDEEQIAVCGACLNDMVQDGTWEIVGGTRSASGRYGLVDDRHRG